ncbi:MAG: flavodoxin [Deltaproteobacteria bacterium]|jgi:flavodoxin|nr:flavodoxin [Deltaproteobacteria bacterium]
MKLVLALAIMILFMTTGLARAAPGKTLVAYFSWSGNTRSIARLIHEQTGGDIFEIVPAKAYSSDYDTFVKEALGEQRSEARPALKDQVQNMAQYEVIYIGYPIWESSIPMPMATFLESYDFSGKTLIPFCSHSGGGMGQSLAAIAKLSPNAKILEALSLHYGGGSSIKSQITAWLKKNGQAP